MRNQHFLKIFSHVKSILFRFFSQSAFISDQRGVSAIEAALVLPVALAIYFGIVDLSYLATGKGRLSTLSDVVGDLVAQSKNTLTKADLNGIYAAAQTILYPYPTGTLGIVVVDYYLNGGTPTIRWQNAMGAACSATPPSQTTLNALMTEGNDVVLTSGCYSVTPITGQVIGVNAIPLTIQTIKRPRYSTTLVCTDC